MTKKKEHRKRDWKELQEWDRRHNQVKWEFLRRNPEYRRLWNLELEKSKIQDKKAILSLPNPSRKWGLPVLINPDQDNPYTISTEVSYGHIEVWGPPLPTWQAKLFFDVRKSLDLQLTFAKQDLLRLRKTLKIDPKEKRQDNMEFYKRCIDVYDLKQKMPNATMKQIAEKIFPDDFKDEFELKESDPDPNPDNAEKKVRYYYERAKEFIESGPPP